MSDGNVATIAIIGAGFCGTTLAVELLRRPPVTPLDVVLINRSGLLARGVAYGTRTASHVLNVPAARMGALAGDVDGFLRFAQRQDPKSTVPASSRGAATATISNHCSPSPPSTRRTECAFVRWLATSIASGRSLAAVPAC